MITLKTKGNFSKTYKFLEKIREVVGKGDFNKYGQMGVQALRSATPVDTGVTAASWGYEIKHTKNGVTITWTNSNLVDRCPVAILVQYGHVTKDGYYVSGRDFINPAIQPVFDDMAESMWREVNSI